jgi:quinohemoprotein ethanol dehydrogenase
MTYGNFGKLLVFKLDGKAELPVPTALDRSIPEQPASDASAEDIARGDHVYHANCAVCHGFMARSSGVVPDLRMTNATRHGLYKEIVLGGMLSGTGMASFADLVDAADVEKLQAYVIKRANDDRATAAASAGGE